MQEEVENRTVTLIVSGSRFTGNMLRSAITTYLNRRRAPARQRVQHHGKMTVKKLIAQDQGVSNITINDPSIKEFERIARKYGVDYAIKKDRSTTPPQYLVFFKRRDADALTAAFAEYSANKVKGKTKDRGSVLATLKKLREQVKAALTPDKHREQERER